MHELSRTPLRHPEVLGPKDLIFEFVFIREESSWKASLLIMYEDINEPIEVATHFKAGKANPVAFRWQRLLFKVSKINLYHKFRTGQDVVHAYSVSTDQGGTFKISFNPNLLTWKLNQIYE